MLKNIATGLAVVLVVLAIVIQTRPADYKVERSAQVAAPPEVPWKQVADFHRWDSWSPWAKLDPEMKTSFSGPTAAVGSVYEWTGNGKVGTGRMTIVEARPGEALGIKLDFLKPFPSTSDTRFSFRPEGPGTRVTWTMSGRNNFVGKAFALVMDFDKTIGKDFEKGLAQLKAVSEAEAGRVAAPAAVPQ